MVRVMLPSIENGLWAVLRLALAFIEVIETMGVYANSVVMPIPMVPPP